MNQSHSPRYSVYGKFTLSFIDFTGADDGKARKESAGSCSGSEALAISDQASVDPLVPTAPCAGKSLSASGRSMGTN